MFGKFMNNYYYGKSGKGDFRKEDLPSNRWQLFGATLRVRISGLFRLNLIYMLCWLPAIIVLCLGALSLYIGLGEASAGDAAAMQAFTDTFYGILSQTLVLLIPCILITGPFTAGLSYVTRNWARDEHAFIWSDFKDAVKANWKQSLAISAITSVMPLLLYVCWMFYGQQVQTGGMFFVIPQVLSATLVLLWMMSLLYMYPMLVTYDMKLGMVFKNSLLLAIGRLPQTLGIKLITLVPAAIAVAVCYFTPYFQWALLALVAYYILLGFSLSRFIQASYSNAVFDKFINKNIEGAVVDRGLYKDLDDDAEDDEPDDDPTDTQA